MHLIFVYGTLKRGRSRATALADQRLLATSFSFPDYRMFRIADYPGLVEVETGTGLAIAGEVYGVDAACLQKLEAIEGVAEGLFERRRIRMDLKTVQWENKRNVNGFSKNNSQPIESIEAYFYLRSVLGLEDCGATF